MSGSSSVPVTSEELRACKIGGCSKDTPMLKAEEVLARMPSLPQWTLSGDGRSIERAFTARNWGASFAFLNQVSAIAEEEGHHPDLHLTGYRNVRVELSTHAIGGLSMGDLILAAKIDSIEVDYSPKWVKEQQARAAEAEADATASTNPAETSG